MHIIFCFTKFGWLNDETNYIYVKFLYSFRKLFEAFHELDNFTVLLNEFYIL